MTEDNPRRWLDNIEGDDAKELIESEAPVVRVIAGPGSGKTECLKRRTEFLIDGKAQDTNAIFVGTFTRAVAQELSSALGNEINVSTLHSYARYLLQKHSVARQGLNLRFLLDFEQDSLLYDIDNENAFEDYKNIYELRNALLQVQSDRAQKREYRNAAFAGAVERWMIRYRAMPVGEVVHLTVSALESGDIPQGRFDQVIIDEYQDLTVAEQQLVRLVWSEKGSLVVLGDDDQSIYGFRFNNPKGITEFDKDWTDIGCKDLSFANNFRCGSEILKTANLMMAEAGSNKPPLDSKSGRIGDQAFIHWESTDHEVRGLAKYINSRPDDSFLVLVPRRFIGNLLADAIGPDAKTKFREEVLEHQIAQEAFAAASLVANPNDSVTIRAWLGFHGTKSEQGARRNSEAYASLPTNLGGMQLIQAIVSGEIPISGNGQQSIRDRAKRAQEILDWNLDTEDAILKLFDPKLAEREEDAERRRWLTEDLKEIRDAAIALLYQLDEPDLTKVLDSLRYRIATRAPLNDVDTDHRVMIMTLHSAKGLQADNVIVAGVARQLIPGSKIDEEKEEQRRLLYVAITRAKHSLIVSWPRSIRYSHMKQYNGLIEENSVFRRENVAWVRTSKSSLIPQAINSMMHGNIWLRNVLD